MPKTSMSAMISEKLPWRPSSYWLCGLPRNSSPWKIKNKKNINTIQTKVLFPINSYGLLYDSTKFAWIAMWWNSLGLLCDLDCYVIVLNLLGLLCDRTRLDCYVTVLIRCCMQVLRIINVLRQEGKGRRAIHTSCLALVPPMPIIENQNISTNPMPGVPMQLVDFDGAEHLFWRVRRRTADVDEKRSSVVLNSEVILLKSHREKALVLGYGTAIHFIDSRLVGHCLCKHA